MKVGSGQVPKFLVLIHRKLILDGVSEDGVLEEADFFQIQPLITLIKTRISQRDQVRRSVMSFVHSFTKLPEFVSNIFAL